MSSEPFRVLARLAKLLDNAGVPYAVGGSFASSLYGPPRATQDIDLLIEVSPAQVDRLAAALAQDFYVNVDEIRDAAAQRSSFNVLHIATMFKADMFFPGNTSCKGGTGARSHGAGRDIGRCRARSLFKPGRHSAP